MKKFISLLVICLMFDISSSAQNLVSVELLKNSSLTISGSTNIISFKLFQNGDKLSKTKLTIATTQSQNIINIGQNQLSVAIKDFASNNPMALRDFLKLLKSDIYPNLQVQLNYLDLQTLSEKEETYKGFALVSITITGITRHYSIPICLKSNGDIYTVNGIKKLSIREFGLTPQSKMMGIIKVSEWIAIDFHLICKLSTANEVVKL